MDVVWILLGASILLVTLLDTFLAVLNYDEPGIFVNRLVRLEWIVIRWFTRRATRRWRPLLLRQVTGILILTTILLWIGGIVIGFSLIYLGCFGLGAITTATGTNPDFVGALYLSVGQFSTVGADNVSPAGGWVNLIPVLETMVSIVLLSFIITFFSNIYATIQLLRSLCADFFSGGAGVGDPVEGLRPYFPDGEALDLNRHLDEMIDDFNLYCDSLRQTHAAYHFQSGQDQFSLPYALYQTAGVVGALRWGLPTGHPATMAPSLQRLTESFDDFRERRYRMMRWPHADAASPISFAQFASELERFRSSHRRDEIDPWTLRFLAIDMTMTDLTRRVLPSGADDAYERYTAWLPFASLAQQFIARTARDLDYQPIYRGIAAAPEDLSADERKAPEPVLAEDSPARTAAPKTGSGRWLRTRRLFLDPGRIRARIASRTVASAAAAALLAAAVTIPLSVEPIVAAVFAGLIALFVTPSTSGWPPGTNRIAGLATALPVLVGIVAGAFLPRDPVSATVILAVVAGLAIWVARFGPLLATLGTAFFIAYFFTLLLAVSPEDVVGVVTAGLVGVALTWLVSILPTASPMKQVHAGVDALTERVVMLLDATVRALSEGRDRSVTRAVGSETSALVQIAASLTDLLAPGAATTGLSADHAERLSLRVVDVQLAARSFLSALPGDSDYVVTIADRAVLAGVIIEAQGQIRSSRQDLGHPAVPPPGTTAAEAHWNRDTVRLQAALRELVGSVAQLHRTVDRRDEGSPRRPVAASPEHVPSTVARAASAAEGRRAARRAVQSALSTGLSLLLANLVSTSLQFWAAMPAFQALNGSDGDRASTTARRLLGTVIGAGAAFGVALATGHSSAVALAILLVSAFFMSALRSVASASSAFWQTVLLATAYDVLSPLDAEAVQVRIVETLIGAGVALVVSLVVLPTRTRVRVLEGMAELVTTVRTVVQGSVQSILDPASPATGLSEVQGLLLRRVNEIRAIAGPLRANSGSARPTGLDAQLAALSAVLAYADELAERAQSIQAKTEYSAMWQHLDALTGDNIAAVLAVLNGRLPSRVHRVVDFISADGSAVSVAEREALVSLERLNQCLLISIESITPGALDD